MHHFPGPSSKLDLTSRRIRIIVDVLAFRQMRGWYRRHPLCMAADLFRRLCSSWVWDICRARKLYLTGAGKSSKDAMPIVRRLPLDRW